MSTAPNDPWPHEHGEAADGVFHAERPRRGHYAHLVGEPEPVRASRRLPLLVATALMAAALGVVGWLVVGSDLVG